MAPQIPRRGLCQPGLADLVGDPYTEGGDAAADLGVLQCGHPVGEPRRQLFELDPLHLVAPRRDLLAVLLVTAQLDEVHPRHRIPTPDTARGESSELLPFPPAIGAAQIVR